MKLTKSLKASEVKRNWVEIDATDIPVGRLSTTVANMLSGRDQPQFTPHVDSGDFVIVTNASKVTLTGNKASSKKYYRHSGYPGSLKERTAAQLMETSPEKVVQAAVYGMLPKNKLRSGMMKRLKVYADAQHNHEAQKPSKVSLEK